MSAGVLTMYLEAAVRAGDRGLAAKLSTCLADLAPLLGEIGITCVARHLGAAAALLGDRAAAYTYSQQALELASRLRFRPEIALTHLQIAELMLSDSSAVSRRGAERASPFHQSGDSPEGNTNVSGDVRADVTAHLEAAVVEFRAMGMQPALERALQLVERVGLLDTSLQSAPLPHPDGLSERELEVLRLIAAGKSNQAIADELVISFNTVIRHVSNVFAKTGVANRTEAASYAHRRGLA